LKFTCTTLAAALLFLLTGCASPSAGPTTPRAGSGVEVFGTIDASVSGRR